MDDIQYRVRVNEWADSVRREDGLAAFVATVAAACVNKERSSTSKRPYLETRLTKLFLVYEQPEPILDWIHLLTVTSFSKHWSKKLAKLKMGLEPPGLSPLEDSTSEDFSSTSQTDEAPAQSSSEKDETKDFSSLGAERGSSNVSKPARLVVARAPLTNKDDTGRRSNRSVSIFKTFQKSASAHHTYDFLDETILRIALEWDAILTRLLAGLRTVWLKELSFDQGARFLQKMIPALASRLQWMVAGTKEFCSIALVDKHLRQPTKYTPSRQLNSKQLSSVASDRQHPYTTQFYNPRACLNLEDTESKNAAAINVLPYVLAGFMMRIGIPYGVNSRHCLVEEETSGKQVIVSDWNRKASLKPKRREKNLLFDELVTYVASGKIRRDLPAGTVTFVVPSNNSMARLEHGTTTGAPAVESCDGSNADSARSEAENDDDKTCWAFCLQGDLIQTELNDPGSPEAMDLIKALVIDRAAHNPLKAPEISDAVANWFVDAMELYTTPSQKAHYHSAVTRMVTRLRDPIERLYGKTSLTVVETKGLVLVFIPFLRKVLQAVEHTFVMTAHHAQLANARVWLDALLADIEPRALHRFVDEICGLKFLARLVHAMSLSWEDIRNSCASFILKVYRWDEIEAALLFDDDRYKFVGGLPHLSPNPLQVLEYIDATLNSHKLRVEDFAVKLFECFFTGVARGDVTSEQGLSAIRSHFKISTAKDQVVVDQVSSSTDTEHSTSLDSTELAREIFLSVYELCKQTSRITSGRIRALQTMIRVLSRHGGLGQRISRLLITDTLSSILLPTVDRVLEVICLGENKMLLAKSIADNSSLNGYNLRVDCRGHVVLVDNEQDETTVGSSVAPPINNRQLLDESKDSSLVHPSSFHSYWMCAKQCGALLSTVIGALDKCGEPEDDLYVFYKTAGEYALRTLFGSRHPGLLESWGDALHLVCVKCSEYAAKLEDARWGSVVVDLIAQVGLAALPETQLRVKSQLPPGDELDAVCERIKLQAVLRVERCDDAVDPCVSDGSKFKLNALPPPLRKSACLITALRAVLISEPLRRPQQYKLADQEGEWLDAKQFALMLYNHFQRIASLDLTKHQELLSDAQYEAVVSAKFHAINAVRGLCLEQSAWLSTAAEHLLPDTKRPVWTLCAKLMFKAVASKDHQCTDFRIRSAANLLFATLQDVVTHCRRFVRIGDDDELLADPCRRLDNELKGSGNFLGSCCDVVRSSAHHPAAEYLYDVLKAADQDVFQLINKEAAEGYSMINLLSLLKPPPTDPAALTVIFSSALSTDEQCVYSTSADWLNDVNWYESFLYQMLVFAKSSPDPIQQMTAAGIVCSAIPSGVDYQELCEQWLAPLLIVGSGSLRDPRLTSTEICLAATVFRGVIRRATLLKEEGYLRKLSPSMIASLRDLHRTIVDVFPESVSERHRVSQHLASVVAEMVALVVGFVESRSTLIDEFYKAWKGRALQYCLATNVIICCFIQVPLAPSIRASIECLQGALGPGFHTRRASIKSPTIEDRKRQASVLIVAEGLNWIARTVQRQLDKSLDKSSYTMSSTIGSSPCAPSCSHNSILLLMENCNNVEVIKAGCRCLLLLKPSSPSSTMKIEVPGARKWAFGAAASVRRSQYLLLHNMLQEWTSSKECSLLIIDCLVQLMLRQMAKKKELTREARAVGNSLIDRLCREFCVGDVDRRFRLHASQIIIKLVKAVPLLRKQEEKISESVMTKIVHVIPHLMTDEAVQEIRMPVRQAVRRVVRKSNEENDDQNLTLRACAQDIADLAALTDVRLRSLLASLCGVGSEGQRLSSVQIPNICSAIDNESAFEDEPANGSNSDAELLTLLAQLVPPLSKKLCAWDDQELIKATTIIAENVKTFIARSKGSEFANFRCLMEPALYNSLVAGKCLDQLLGIPGSLQAIDF